MSILRRIRSLAAPLVELAYRGKGRECPCCGRQFRSFLPFGSPPRADAACPRCGSLERHRLLTRWLDKNQIVLGGRTLHFAPEAATARALRTRASEYVTCDLFQEADVKADITSLPFPDGRWDLVVCSHVLEHVADDGAAMREVRRILAPAGRAIVMTPRKHGLPTEEDPSAPEDERIRRFGQFDHVRLYGDDLEDRLLAAGFTSIEPIDTSIFSAEEVQRYRLETVSPVENAAFLCTV